MSATPSFEEIISSVDQLSPGELSRLERAISTRTKTKEESLRPIHAGSTTETGKFKDKILPIALLLGALVAGCAIAYFLTARETFATSDRRDEFGANIGYKIEQYRFGNRVLLDFKAGARSSLEYDLSPLRVDKVVEQRWLSNGRAIYLNMLVKPNSRTAPSPARVIYDFQRGEMFVSSPMSMWRTPSSGNRWMSEAELDGVLARYVQ
jgi:hypothetical protein